MFYLQSYFLDYMFDTSKIDVFNPPDLFNQTVLPTFLGSPTFFTEVQCSNTFIEVKGFYLFRYKALFVKEYLPNSENKD